MGIYICVPDMTCRQIFSKYGVQVSFPTRHSAAWDRKAGGSFISFSASFLPVSSLSSASPLCARHVSPLTMALYQCIITARHSSPCSAPQAASISSYQRTTADFRHGLRFSQAFSSVDNANHSKSLNRGLLLAVRFPFSCDSARSRASFSQH
ncbi:hypothetical protein BDZ97DRAFT_1861187 [Flammula alnicola]|nr:hypothetical protein BDZ97DRAFT_1861187 [Flammula alnicola]